ncbi:hypothetical protein SUGI_1022120 [Cryptomeria japonica]|nr:hypothetical protein SUGI_1022120 [Cryptomeria japonica]
MALGVNNRASYRETQIRKGVEFVKNHAERMEKEADNHRPCGFEFVFISMLKEAKSLGLDLPYDLPFIKQINQKRETKLEKIPLNIIHAVPTTILYSLEGLQEIIDWDKIMKLQLKDGSFLNSPASTAAAFIRTGDKKCLEYLTFVVNKFDDHAPCQYPIDLFARLHWNDEGIGWAKHSSVTDIDDTSMALRILRLHGYNVSSDALKGFRDKNGEFFCFMGQTHRAVTDMFNVHRFSHVAFPGETIMEEARLFTHKYLTNAVQNVGTFDKWALKKDLQGEVEYVLKYPWHRSMPRLEARSYIEQYGGENDVWLSKALYLMPNVSNGKYLELAKLDFNNMQSMHQNEIPHIQRWLELCGFNKFFTQKNVVQTYFIISTSMFEPEFATCRAVYTKTAILTVILSDLFESHCSVADIMVFSEAVQRWDLSLVNSMAEEMKICFKALYDTLNQIAEQGRIRQGRDVLPYLRNLWEVLLASYSKETERMQMKYIRSMEEYTENAKESMGVATVILTSILFTGDLLSDEVLVKFGNGSRFLYLVALTGTLAKDIKTYQDKRRRGKPWAIEKFIRNHPEASEKEAMDHINSVMQSALLKLNWEVINNREMGERCRKLIFNTARSMQLFYMERDSSEMEEVIKKCLFEPVGI